MPFPAHRPRALPLRRPAPLLLVGMSSMSYAPMTATLTVAPQRSMEYSAFAVMAPASRVPRIIMIAFALDGSGLSRSAQNYSPSRRTAPLPHIGRSPLIFAPTTPTVAACHVAQRRSAPCSPGRVEPRGDACRAHFAFAVMLPASRGGSLFLAFAATSAAVLHCSRLKRPLFIIIRLRGAQRRNAPLLRDGALSLRGRWLLPPAFGSS